MKEKESLSEKRIELLKEMLIPCDTDEEKAHTIAIFDFIANQDKEFIKRQAELVIKFHTERMSAEEFWEKWYKLAGKLLIENG